MSDTRAMQALADVLVWISAHEKSEAGSYDTEALKLRRRVTAEWPPIDHYTLRRLLNHRRGDAVSIGNDTSDYIYGPVSRVGGLWLPVVSLAWNFGHTSPVLRFRVAMFVLAGSRLKASGSRFETPEHGPRHMYFHVQQINAFGSSGRSLPVTGPVNVRQLAIPVDAISPVSLVLAALVALYDTGFVGDLVTSVPGVRPYIRELRCL